MASMEAIGEPGARRRRQVGRRGSGKREGRRACECELRSAKLCNCVQVGGEMLLKRQKMKVTIQGPVPVQFRLLKHGLGLGWLQGLILIPC